MATGQINKFASTARSFLETLAADATWGFLSGAVKNPAGKETVGAALGKEIKDSLFGIGLNDERAYFKAVKTIQLNDPESAERIIDRVDSLDQVVPNARRATTLFRRLLTELKDDEAVECLRAVAEMEDDVWEMFVRTSGIAANGNIVAALKLAKEMLDISVPKLLLALQDFDSAAAANFTRFDQSLSGIGQRLKDAWKQGTRQQ